MHKITDDGQVELFLQVAAAKLQFITERKVGQFRVGLLKQNRELQWIYGLQHTKDSSIV